MRLIDSSDRFRSSASARLHFIFCCLDSPLQPLYSLSALGHRVLLLLILFFQPCMSSLCTWSSVMILCCVFKAENIINIYLLYLHARTHTFVRLDLSVLCSFDCMNEYIHIHTLEFFSGLDL